MSKVMLKRGFQLSTDTDLPRSEDPILHMVDYCQAMTNLSKFYSSRKVLDLSWHAKRARKSEFDRAIHQLLVMVNGACHTKAGYQNVVFGIGDASVKGWSGQFLEYLVLKLKSLGYNHIYYVGEAYTSQKCPRCQTLTQLVPNTRKRIKRCRACNTYFHRDEMAGHNMAVVLESNVHSGQRPDYLTAL